MLKPLSNNLLIKGLEDDNVTASGLIIAKTHRERPTTGRVIAVGPDVKSLKEGDKVLIKGYMVDEIEIDKEKFLIGQEDAVIGTING